MARAKSQPETSLDAVLHQPVRTQIVAYLIGREEATFSEFKRVLRVSDGNLESHMKKLIAADYIATRKDASSARQQTVYSLTQRGLRQFSRRNEMKTLCALSVCALLVATGCATQPPSADSLSRLPVVQFGETVPAGADYIL